MSNHHCGTYGCVLSPWHINAGTPHVNAAGFIAQPRSEANFAESIRQRCILFGSESKYPEVRELAQAAAELNPYVTFAVLLTLNKAITTVGPGYVRAALANHGLHIKETK